MESKNKGLLLKKIDELIDIIKNSIDYKRYLELKDEMKKNKELMSIISKIKKLEQSIVNKEYRKENTNKEEKELHNLKEELDTYPIYKEYTYIQEDLNNLFQNIRSIIESSIKKINS